MTDHILPDVLAENLKLVFCGTAPSIVSAQKQAYYANPTNAFWKTLYTIGLTPTLMQPQSFRELLSLGIGLTDLVKGRSGNDDVLLSSDYDLQALITKLSLYRPLCIAFTSKQAASVALNIPTKKLAYGQQNERLVESVIWVLPSPSGQARSYWDIQPWQALATFYQQM